MTDTTSIIFPDDANLTRNSGSIQNRMRDLATESDQVKRNAARMRDQFNSMKHIVRTGDITKIRDEVISAHLESYFGHFRDYRRDFHASLNRKKEIQTNLDAELQGKECVDLSQAIGDGCLALAVGDQQMVSYRINQDLTVSTMMGTNYATLESTSANAENIMFLSSKFGVVSLSVYNAPCLEGESFTDAMKRIITICGELNE